MPGPFTFITAHAIMEGKLDHHTADERQDWLPDESPRAIDYPGVVDS